VGRGQLQLRKMYSFSRFMALYYCHSTDWSGYLSCRLEMPVLDDEKIKHLTRVSAILKVGASKVREGIQDERLSKEVSHSSCTLLDIWLKPC